MRFVRNVKKYDMYGSDQKCIQEFNRKNKGKMIFDKVNVDERIILKVCLNNYDVTMWIAHTFVKKGHNGRQRIKISGSSSTR
jgi:hypothetical protein